MELLLLYLLRKLVKRYLDLLYCHSQKLKLFADFIVLMIFMISVMMVILLWQEITLLNLIKACCLQIIQEVLLYLLVVCLLIYDVIENVVEDGSAGFLH